MWVSPTPSAWPPLGCSQKPMRAPGDSAIAQRELEAGTQPTSSLLFPSKPHVHSLLNLWGGVG